MKKLFALALVQCCVTSHVSAAPAEAEFDAAVDASVLADLMDVESPTVTTPISRYVNGTMINGTALTSTRVTLAPYEERDGLGLRLSMASYTDAYSVAQNQPRPHISIEFDSTIATAANTTKLAYLSKTGFMLYDAQSTAQSVMTLHSLETYADGLFSRLRSRIAYDRAMAEIMAQKANMEAQTSAEIINQLNTLVDQRTWDMLLPLQEKYYTYFYWPLLSSGILSDVSFKSDTRGFYAYGGRPGQQTQAAVSAAEPVRLSVNDALVSKYASRQLSGKSYSGQDIADLLSKGGDVSGGLDISDEAKGLQMEFTNADAVFVTIRASGEMDVRIAFRSLQTADGLSASDVVMETKIAIATEDGVILLDTDKPLTVSAQGLTSADGRRFADLLRELFPALTVELSNLTLLKSTLPLQIKSVAFTDGRVTMLMAKARP